MTPSLKSVGSGEEVALPQVYPEVEEAVHAAWEKLSREARISKLQDTLEEGKSDKETKLILGAATVHSFYCQYHNCCGIYTSAKSATLRPRPHVRGFREEFGRELQHAHEIQSKKLAHSAS